MTDPRDRPLSEPDLDPDPLALFRRWFDAAAETGTAEPEAVALATATPDGRPSARMVLAKGVDERGFAFYTNHGSRKGGELEANPRAALLFHWPALGRQVVEVVEYAASDREVQQVTPCQRLCVDLDTFGPMVLQDDLR